MTAKKYRTLKRLLAAVLCVTMTATSVPAGSAGVVNDAPTTMLPYHDITIAIPAEIGTISERRDRKRSKTIIYIQDAHDSLEAQENIAKLINHLVENYGVKTVFEEGYEGKVPTDDYFSSIKDPKAREKVSYFLLDKLRIGGAEYAHINRKKDFKLIGADNIKLHLENVDWYRKAAEDKTTTEKDLAALHFHIENLAYRYFPEELKEWMKFKEKFDRGELDLVGYLDRARTVFVQKIGAETFQQEYPHIELLRFAGNTDDPEIYEQVKTVKPVALFQEIDRMENEFAMTVIARSAEGATKQSPTSSEIASPPAGARNDVLLKIFDYYKGVALIKRLSNIEINSDEFEAVKDTLVRLKTEPLAHFISDRTKKSVVLSKRWEVHIQNAIEYYETSRKRDDVIKKEFTDFLTNSSEDTAVLVFGGFHKDRIREIFRQTGVSYVIVTPKITELNPKHRDYYKQLMSVGRHSFEVPFSVSTGARPPNSFEINGRDFVLVLNKAISRTPNTDLRNPISMRQLEESLARGFGAAGELSLRGAETFEATQSRVRPEIASPLSGLAMTRAFSGFGAGGEEISSTGSTSNILRTASEIVDELKKQPEWDESAGALNALGKTLWALRGRFDEAARKKIESVLEKLRSRTTPPDSKWRIDPSGRPHPAVAVEAGTYKDREVLTRAIFFKPLAKLIKHVGIDNVKTELVKSHSREVAVILNEVIRVLRKQVLSDSRAPPVEKPARVSRPQVVKTLLIAGAFFSIAVLFVTAFVSLLNRIEPAQYRPLASVQATALPEFPSAEAYQKIAFFTPGEFRSAKPWLKPVLGHSAVTDPAFYARAQNMKVFALEGPLVPGEIFYTSILTWMDENGALHPAQDMEEISQGNATGETVTVRAALENVRQGDQLELLRVVNGTVTDIQYDKTLLRFDEQTGRLVGIRDERPDETSSIAWTIKRYSRNNMYRFSERSVPERELETLPDVFKRILDPAKDRDAPAKVNAIRTIFRKYFSYALIKFRKSENETWGEKARDTLGRQDRIRCDCDVLATYLFLFARYLDLPANVLIGLLNNDQNIFLTINEGHAANMVAIQVEGETIWFSWDVTADTALDEEEKVRREQLAKLRAEEKTTSMSRAAVARSVAQDIGFLTATLRQRTGGSQDGRPLTPLEKVVLYDIYGLELFSEDKRVLGESSLEERLAALDRWVTGWPNSRTKDEARRDASRLIEALNRTLDTEDGELPGSLALSREAWLHAMHILHEMARLSYPNFYLEYDAAWRSLLTQLVDHYFRAIYPGIDRDRDREREGEMAELSEFFSKSAIWGIVPLRDYVDLLIFERILRTHGKLVPQDIPFLDALLSRSNQTLDVLERAILAMAQHESLTSEELTFLGRAEQLYVELLDHIEYWDRGDRYHQFKEKVKAAGMEEAFKPIREAREEKMKGWEESDRRWKEKSEQKNTEESGFGATSQNKEPFSGGGTEELGTLPDVVRHEHEFGKGGGEASKSQEGRVSGVFASESGQSKTLYQPQVSEVLLRLLRPFVQPSFSSLHSNYPSINVTNMNVQTVILNFISNWTRKLAAKRLAKMTLAQSIRVFATRFLFPWLNKFMGYLPVWNLISLWRGSVKRLAKYNEIVNRNMIINNYPSRATTAGFGAASQNEEPSSEHSAEGGASKEDSREAPLTEPEEKDGLRVLVVGDSPLVRSYESALIQLKGEKHIFIRRANSLYRAISYLNKQDTEPPEIVMVSMRKLSDERISDKSKGKFYESLPGIAYPKIVVPDLEGRRRELTPQGLKTIARAVDRAWALKHFSAEDFPKHARELVTLHPDEAEDLPAGFSLEDVTQFYLAIRDVIGIDTVHAILVIKLDSFDVIHKADSDYIIVPVGEGETDTIVPVYVGFRGDVWSFYDASRRSDLVRTMIDSFRVAAKAEELAGDPQKVMWQVALRLTLRRFNPDGTLRGSPPTGFGASVQGQAAAFFNQLANTPVFTTENDRLFFAGKPDDENYAASVSWLPLTDRILVRFKARDQLPKDFFAPTAPADYDYYHFVLPEDITWKELIRFRNVLAKLPQGSQGTLFSRLSRRYKTAAIYLARNMETQKASDTVQAFISFLHAVGAFLEDAGENSEPVFLSLEEIKAKPLTSVEEKEASGWLGIDQEKIGNWQKKLDGNEALARRFFSKLSRPLLNSAIQTARIEIEAVTFQRGFRLLAQQLIGDEGRITIDLDRLKSNLRAVEGKTKDDIAQIQIETIEEVLKSVRTLPGWIKEGYERLLFESSPTHARAMGELNCVGRCGAVAEYLTDIGIPLSLVDVQLFRHKAGDGQHVLLLAYLANGAFYWVEPSTRLLTFDGSLRPAEFDDIPKLEGHVFELSYDTYLKRFNVMPLHVGLLAYFYNNLGLRLLEQKRYDEGEASLRKAIELVPELSLAHNNLGLLLRERNRYDEAEASFRKAIELNPDSVLAHKNLANLLRELKRNDEAEFHERRAIELDPKYVQAKKKLASYREAVELDPQSALAHSNLGSALHILRNYGEAEDHFREAIRWDPRYAEAYKNLGLLLSEQGRQKEAEEYMNRFIEIQRRAAIARSNPGIPLPDPKQYGNAEASYRENVERDPQSAVAHFNLGFLLHYLKRYAEAEASYRKAIELDPQYAEAYKNLGNLLTEIARYTEALEIFTRAAQINSPTSSGFGAALKMDMKTVSEEPELKLELAVSRSSHKAGFGADAAGKISELEKQTAIEGLMNKLVRHGWMKGPVKDKLRILYSPEEELLSVGPYKMLQEHYLHDFKVLSIHLDRMLSGPVLEHILKQNLLKETPAFKVVTTFKSLRKDTEAGFGAERGAYDSAPKQIQIKGLLERLEKIRETVEKHPTLPNERWKELLTKLDQVWPLLRTENYFEAAEQLRKLVHDPVVIHDQERYLSRSSIRWLANAIERASVPEELLQWFRESHRRQPDKNGDRYEVLDALVKKVYGVELGEVMRKIKFADADEIKQTPNQPIFVEAILEWRNKKQFDLIFYRYANIYPVAKWPAGKIPMLSIPFGMSRHFGPAAWTLFINHFARKVSAARDHHDHRTSGFGAALASFEQTEWIYDGNISVEDREALFDIIEQRGLSLHFKLMDDYIPGWIRSAVVKRQNTAVGGFFFEMEDSTRISKDGRPGLAYVYGYVAVNNYVEGQGLGGRLVDEQIRLMKEDRRKFDTAIVFHVTQSAVNLRLKRGGKIVEESKGPSGNKLYNIRITLTSQSHETNNEIAGFGAEEAVGIMRTGSRSGFGVAESVTNHKLYTEIDIAMVDHVRSDVVFSMDAKTIQNLSPEKWTELLALKALNQEKLHILIRYDRIEELAAPRVEELRNDFKNVRVGVWSNRLPQNAPVFYFSDPTEGIHPSKRLDPQLARRINGRYFGLLFGVALLYEFHEEKLPGLMKMNGYWNDPTGWYASEVLSLLFNSYVAVARAA